jgi:hypothetical protein
LTGLEKHGQRYISDGNSKTVAKLVTTASATAARK